MYSFTACEKRPFRFSTSFLTAAGVNAGGRAKDELQVIVIIEQYAAQHT
jgi:hypothetical protein